LVKKNGEEFWIKSHVMSQLMNKSEMLASVYVQRGSANKLSHSARSWKSHKFSSQIILRRTPRSNTGCN